MEGDFSTYAVLSLRDVYLIRSVISDFSTVDGPKWRRSVEGDYSTYGVRTYGTSLTVSYALPPERTGDVVWVRPAYVR